MGKSIGNQIKIAMDFVDEAVRCCYNIHNFRPGSREAGHLIRSVMEGSAFVFTVKAAEVESCPDNFGIYDELYAVFQKLYPALKEPFRELSSVREKQASEQYKGG